MIPHIEHRGLPKIHGMAFGALALLRTCFELALVGVWFMTILAIIKRQGLLEVSLQMALRAAHLGVFSEQGVLGLGMVESKSGQQFFPSRGGVTFFAALFERASVRIDMAVDASLELHVPVTCRTTGHIRFVALLTVHLDVKTRQRIAGLGVIELIGGLPIHVIVTLQAIVSELAFVHIFVARHAILRQPEKGFRDILHLDECALLGNHVCRRVALLTSKARMLSFQDVTRQPVIKLFL